MEKLLHERLREHDDTNTGSWHTIRLFDNWELKLSKHGANSLADEIERYYIPRPRFEDGEPVQFGDEVDGCDGKLNSLLLFEDGSGQAYGINDDWVRQPLDSCELYPENALKRPSPKVSDADGVEIKVGDTVWTSMYTDNPYTVERISTNHKGEPLVMVKEMGSGLFPATCYHERPVFDTEGVRICKGDTVWFKETGEKHFVEELTGDGGIYIDRSSITWGGDMFTHREPDSLEKLRDDMQTFAAAKHPASSETMSGYCDRLTALIERCA